MNWRISRAQAFLLGFLSLALIWTYLLLWGSRRYGGLDGLLLRARMEIAGYRPHPQFVPTPLPTSTDALLATTTEHPPAALTPSPTRALPSPVSSPAASPAAAPSPILSPTTAHPTAQTAVELTGLTHMWQKWNNCGPATLAMNLSYFGHLMDQAEVAASLKGNQDDKNVSPEEMADFARAQGLNAVVRVNGNADRLRLLLSNGIPVIIETWHEPEPGDGMGHYRLLTGYDDQSQHWLAFDSFDSTGVDLSQPYGGIRLSYDEVDELWAVFNRAYIAIYPDDLTPVVLSILAEDSVDAIMWQRALRHAQIEVEQRPDSAFAWFNLGTDLVALDQFEQAAAAYDRARVIGLPWRMMWYQFGAFRSYYEIGRYEELISLADATIATADNIEEIYYWRGLGLAARGDTARARQAWQKAIELNPSYPEAAAALAAFEQPPLDDTQPESMLYMVEG